MWRPHFAPSALMLVNGGEAVMDNFGPATYGERIAESYDELYPSSSNTDAMVETLAKLAGTGPVLELGKVPAVWLFLSPQMV
jgi:hypothetical protein